MILDALQELDVRDLKHFPELLTSSESALAQALSEQIGAALDKDLQTVLTQPVKKGAMPAISGDLPVEKRKEPYRVGGYNTGPMREKKPLELTLQPHVKPGEVKVYLQHAVEYFGQYAGKTTQTQYMQLRELMLALPQTLDKEPDPFWDQIPKDSVFEVIWSLHRLAEIAQQHDVFGIIPVKEKSDYNLPFGCSPRRLAQNGCRIHNCEIGLIAFDIAAQLAARDDELKMNGEYAFELSDVYLDQALFHDVESYQLVKRIIANFKRRCAGKKAIFGAIIDNSDSEAARDATRKYLLENLLVGEGRELFCKKETNERFPSAEKYPPKKMMRSMMWQTGGLGRPYITDHLQYLVKLFIFTISPDLNVARAFAQKEKLNGATSDTTNNAEPDNIWQRSRGFYENASFHPNDELLWRRNQPIQNHTYFHHYPGANDHAWHPLGTSRRDLSFDQRQKDPKGVLEEWIDEDFRRIEASPNLQVQQIMEWAQCNVDQLSQPLVQNRIFSFLFEYGKIEQAYRDDPKDFVALVTHFQKMLWEYSTKRTSSLDVLLWTARLTHYLKAYFSECTIPATLIETRPYLIARFEKAKNQGERIALADCLVHSYQSQKDFSAKDSQDLFLYLGLSRMRFHHESSLYTVADYTNLKLQFKHQKEVVGALSALSPSELSAFANRYVKVTAKIDLKRAWKMNPGRGLEDEAREYRIDLQTGQLSKNENPLINIASELKADQSSWRDYLRSFEDPQHILVKSVRGTIESIEFKRFDLHLELKSVDGETRFYAREPQGYYWLPQSTIPDLRGIPGAFVLRNDEGDIKVLLPARKMQKAEKSTAFQPFPQLDFNDKLLTHSFSDERPYFVYQYDKQRQLVGQTVAADLYLSLIYRGLHDYKRAMAALDRTSTHVNNTPLLWEIAYQLLCQKDMSLSGAAFDHHFANRMLRHRGKWSHPQEMNSNPNMIYQFLEHAQKQYDFLRMNLSDSKSSIYNLPEYLRIAEPARPIEPRREAAILTSERLEELSKFAGLHGDRQASVEISWSNAWDEPHVFKQSKQQQFITRIPSDGSEYPALNYMRNNFIGLFERACAESPDARASFQADLLLLIHNDLEWNPQQKQLVAALLYVFNHPAFFRRYAATKFQDPRTCYEEIMSAILRLPDCNKPLYLFPQNSAFSGYVRSITPAESRLGNGASVAFNIDPLAEEARRVVPLQDLCSSYFKEPTARFVAQGPFPLAANAEQTKLEKRLLERYQGGHKDNQVKKKWSYQFQDGKTTQQLQAALNGQKKEDVKQSEKLLSEILRLARTIHAASTGQTTEELQRILTHLAALKANQKTPISLGDLLMSLLKKKPELLMEKNDFLNQSQIQALYAKVVDYCLIQSRISQVDDALEVLEEAKRAGKNELDQYFQQCLGMTLHKRRTYDIEKYPEFLVYEYATGKMLPPAQVKILTWIIERIETASPGEMRHLLVQFAAGGGKTAVIIPILAHRFAGKGYLPIIINTNDLYDTAVQDIPESLRASFGQKVEVLEVELNEEWTEEKLKTLLTDLQRWKKEEKVLLVKEVTWAAIHTAKKIAYANGKESLGRQAQAVEKAGSQIRRSSPLFIPEPQSHDGDRCQAEANRLRWVDCREKTNRHGYDPGSHARAAAPLGQCPDGHLDHARVLASRGQQWKPGV